ncbi:hypothetical protein M569_06628, partial [Genlisea aurea]
NFAVAGATALNRSTLASYGIQSLDVPYLLMQLDWYELYLANNPIPDYLYTVIGPIGGNDIIYAITQCNKTYNEISSMIPMIAETIVTVVKKILLSVNAVDQIHYLNLNFPLGCFPFIIDFFSYDPNIEKDTDGCIKMVNELVMDLNSNISSMVTDIRVVDIYSAYLDLIRDETYECVKFTPCCGNGGFVPSNIFCGGEDAFLCSNPDDYIHWDGVHLTSSA